MTFILALTIHSAIYTIHFISAPSRAAASRPEMEDTNSGRPCREKLTGEISVYSGLGEGRTGSVSATFQGLFFKAEANRELTEGYR